MKEYPKIPKMRDSKSNGIFRDDEDKIIITEKVDGANFRWKMYDENTLLTGSRRGIFTKNNRPLEPDQVPSKYKHTVKYLYSEIPFNSLRDVYKKYGELIFYGESMHRHAIEYNYEGKNPDIESTFPNYIGFDIWSEKDNKWLDFEDIEYIHEILNLELTKVVGKRKVEDLKEKDLEIPSSEYREKKEESDNRFERLGLAEGIVIRNENNKMKGKKVCDRKKEIDDWDDKSELTIKQKRYYSRNIGKFTSTFVTRGRVVDNAYKLIDRGEYDELCVQMMADLPEMVIRDIMAEEGWKIINDKYGIDLNSSTKERIRKEASREVNKILQEEIKSKK